MTNDALKAAALKIIIRFNEADWLWCVDDTERQEAADLLFSQLQPLIDADQQRIERLEKALRELRDAYTSQAVYNIARQALGEGNDSPQHNKPEGEVK